MKSNTVLKVQDGKYKIKTVDVGSGETTVHAEGFFVNNCPTDKWWTIEPLTEEAKIWFEQNGCPSIRKFYMEHYRDNNEFLITLRKMVADFNK